MPSRDGTQKGSGDSVVKKIMKLVVSVCGLIGCSAWGLDNTVPTITLHYNQRIPYEYLDNSRVSGILVEPIVAAFTAAGIPFVWSNTPIKRQFVLLQANRGLDCLVGRYKSPEREAYAQFSAPFYRGKPLVALSLRNQEQIEQERSLKALIQNPSLRLLLKDGYIYGPPVDSWIKARTSPPQRTTGENISMLREVFYGKSDLFLLGQEEAEALLETSGLPKEQLKIHTFADAPAGELRHLMCSKLVPRELLERINGHLPEISAKEHG